MANNKKMTKRDYFEAIKSKYALTTDEIAFIDHELELLAKKNVNKSGEKKLTAKQVANNGFKELILDIIATEKHTITEMLKLGNFGEDITNQRISAIVKQMIAEGTVIRIEENRKAYFKAVED